MDVAKHYDLIVIGSGPAGEKGAAQAAFFGKKVALIEKQPVLGGAGANTGTLPSKTLRETSLLISEFHKRKLFTLDFGLKEEVSLRDFMSRERFITDTERARIQKNLDRHGIRRYAGRASFVDANTVSVVPEGSAEIRLSADVILIATGSIPYRPPSFPYHDPRILDSDTILMIHDIPKTLTVVGGGVIGCEYACIFSVIGVDVTVIEKRDRILDFMDAEISVSLQHQMESKGIRFLLDDAVEGITAEDRLRLRLKSGEFVEADKLLVSSGRSGNTVGLGLDRAGVATGERGKIKVDPEYRTSAPNVYAAGDVIGAPALASTSMEQARVAITNAFELKYKDSVSPVLPFGVYTIPECSMAGETEESLVKSQIPYVVGRASYAANARGQIIGDDDGFLKLLFHQETKKLLGVHVIGEQATELVHVGLSAILMDAGTELFIRTCYNYPTLSELYKYATYDALGKLHKLGKA